MGQRLETYLYLQDMFNDTKVTLTGLSPVTRYILRVFAENGVSSLAGPDSKQAEITVSTAPSNAYQIKNFKGTYLLIIISSLIKQRNWDLGSFLTLNC